MSPCLCFAVNRQRDVESHSHHCSTSSHDIPVTLTLPSVAMGTDILLVSVTRAPSTAATWAPFKVVTKVCRFPLYLLLYGFFTEQCLVDEW